MSGPKRRKVDGQLDKEAYKPAVSVVKYKDSEVARKFCSEDDILNYLAKILVKAYLRHKKYEDKHSTRRK